MKRKSAIQTRAVHAADRKRATDYGNNAHLHLGQYI